MADTPRYRVEPDKKTPDRFHVLDMKRIVYVRMSIAEEVAKTAANRLNLAKR